MFQRIFHKSPAIFTAFIDVGHYVHTIEKYQPVVDKLNKLSVSMQLVKLELSVFYDVYL